MVGKRDTEQKARQDEKLDGHELNEVEIQSGLFDRMTL